MPKQQFTAFCWLPILHVQHIHPRTAREQFKFMIFWVCTLRAQARSKLLGQITVQLASNIRKYAEQKICFSIHSGRHSVWRPILTDIEDSIHPPRSVTWLFNPKLIQSHDTPYAWDYLSSAGVLLICISICLFQGHLQAPAQSALKLISIQTR